MRKFVVSGLWRSSGKKDRIPKLQKILWFVKSTLSLPTFFPTYSDFTQSERKPRRRLKTSSFPSLFSFRPEPKFRPSTSKRKQEAHARRYEYEFNRILPKCGPLTKSESLEDQLEQAKLKIAALERTTSDLKRENELLKYEVFRFRNVKTDSDQLMYMTGLTFQIWNTLWEFLEPCERRNIGMRYGWGM